MLNDDDLFDKGFNQITGLVWAFDGCCLYSCSQVFFFWKFSFLFVENTKSMDDYILWKVVYSFLFFEGKENPPLVYL